VTFAIVVALLTPFRDDDGAVDLETLGAHVDWLAGEGVDGLLVGGTTSEGPLLSAGELDASVVATVAANAGRARVIAQVGAPGTAETIARLEAATAAGADAAAAVGPYYYHLTQEQLLAHYRALLAAAGPMPLLAYNIPSRTVNDLLPPMIATLAREGLAGIKDSTKSLERLDEYLAAAPPGAAFEVFAGSDSLAAPALRAGAHGIVSAIANANPELLRTVRDAPDGDALEQAQQALSKRRGEIQRDGTLATLKSATAERLGTVGIRYPTAMRAPLS
jgi:4-hydroxy-tetrahydrodipicolinate synthase